MTVSNQSNAQIQVSEVLHHQYGILDAFEKTALCEGVLCCLSLPKYSQSNTDYLDLDNLDYPLSVVF